MSYRRRSNSLVWIVVMLFVVLIVFSGSFMWLLSDDEGQTAVDSLQKNAESLFSGRDLSGSSSSAASSETVDMEITAGVTHSVQGEYRNITITSSNTILKNKIVTGDIVIADSVKNGVVTLENVVVRGKIIANGGSVINLTDVTAIELLSQFEGGETRYNVGGKSFIHQLTAGNSIVIDESELKNGYTGIKMVAAPEGKKLRRVVLKSGSVEQKTNEEDEDIEKAAHD